MLQKLEIRCLRHRRGPNGPINGSYHATVVVNGLCYFKEASLAQLNRWITPIFDEHGLERPRIPWKQMMRTKETYIWKKKRKR